MTDYEIETNALSLALSFCTWYSINQGALEEGQKQHLAQIERMAFNLSNEILLKRNVK